VAWDDTSGIGLALTTILKHTLLYLYLSFAIAYNPDGIAGWFQQNTISS
jgi:hypothetical protein